MPPPPPPCTATPGSRANQVFSPKDGRGACGPASACPAGGWAAFPAELLAAIFGQLDQPSLISAGQACRAWLEASLLPFPRAMAFSTPRLAYKDGRLFERLRSLSLFLRRRAASIHSLSLSIRVPRFVHLLAMRLAREAVRAASQSQLTHLALSANFSFSLAGGSRGLVGLEAGGQCHSLLSCPGLFWLQSSNENFYAPGGSIHLACLPACLSGCPACPAELGTALSTLRSLHLDSAEGSLCLSGDMSSWAQLTRLHVGALRVVSFANNARSASRSACASQSVCLPRHGCPVLVCWLLAGLHTHSAARPVCGPVADLASWLLRSCFPPPTDEHSLHCLGCPAGHSLPKVFMNCGRGSPAPACQPAPTQRVFPAGSLPPSLSSSWPASMTTSLPSSASCQPACSGWWCGGRSCRRE